MASRLTSLGLALIGGLAWGSVFSARPSLLLPWLGLVPVVLLLEREHAPAWIFLAGCVSWIVALRWIVATVSTYGGLSPWIGVGALLLLAAILSLPWWLFGWLGRDLWVRGGAGLWLGLPLLWVAAEVIRGRFLTGFPWNLAAYSVVEVPGVLAMSSWLGAFGVSGLVAAVNVAVARGLRERRLAAIAVPLVVLLCLGIAGRWGGAPVAEAGEAVEAVEVRIVQPNIQNLTAWDADRVEEGYERLLALSREACDRPALLIWPESATWPKSWQSDARLQRDLADLGRRGCAVLLNTTWTEGERNVNAALLVDGERAVGRYDKRHLVPFGEYVPVWLPVPGTLARNVGSFDRGSGANLIPYRDLEIGVAICYEIVFPGEVADFVRAGADLLVTMTNDAWYGDTAAPWQHFRAARFRAAETGRPVLRAAITGISGWIDPDGSVASRLGVGETGYLQGTAGSFDGKTVFSRAPALLPLLSIGWCLVAGVRVCRARWRARAVRRGEER